MEVNGVSLIVLGLLFLTGLAVDALGHRTKLPRVTLLLLCGLFVGGAGLDLIPRSVQDLYPMVSVVALGMVAFLLGGELSLNTLREHGRGILVISLSVVIVTMVVVSAGLWAIGISASAALLIGALATATDPAAIYDVVREKKAKGGFSRTLKGIVAIDDAWGVMLFALVLVVAQRLNGTLPDDQHLLSGVFEVLGSILLGTVIGIPAAFLTGRLSDGEPLRIEALGLVCLTTGLALWLELSYLIAGMTAGAVIANLARHHTKAFREIEHLEWPFMIIFFILAGASLDSGALLAVGPLGLAYVLLRILSRVLGGWIGGAAARSPEKERRWYGVALLPQAGVAIGMALIAADLFPEHGSNIMALAVSATVVFEIIGPLSAAWAITRVEKPKT
ncbi:sodium:proton antiporter [Ruegeria marisrubri]|uniref:Sodium:proton antiporter n=1 Tax=Ruegeria marisrubri TaxID=1685379 RepID=A0A101CZH6_9RHOB|nr:cation:proton antiporter [Ruegeria marisrubri]KUJ86080.1 sodium:proton antiporter [Ruegeria marisrubri]